MIKVGSAAMALLFFLSAIAAHADSFQSSVRASYDRIDFAPISDDQIITGLSGSWYFAPVDVAAYPYAEAAFMQRASHAYLSGSRAKLASSSVDTGSVGVAYFDPRWNLYAELEGIRIKNGFSQSLWRLRLGAAPRAGTLIYADYLDYYDIWEVGGKHVFAAFGQTFNLEAAVRVADMTDTYLLASDWYLDRSWSFGLGYQYQDVGNFGSVNRYLVRSRKFFGPLFNLGTEYQRNSESDQRLALFLESRF